MPLGRNGWSAGQVLRLGGNCDRLPSFDFGDVLLNGKSEEELTAWRGRNVGVVFQFFQLLPRQRPGQGFGVLLHALRTAGLRNGDHADAFLVQAGYSILWTLIALVQ